MRDGGCDVCVPHKATALIQAQRVHLRKASLDRDTSWYLGEIGAREQRIETKSLTVTGSMLSVKL